MLNSLDNLKQSIYLNIQTLTCILFNKKYVQQDLSYCHLTFISKFEEQVLLTFDLHVGTL
jgi:hypothetical protein